MFKKIFLILVILQFSFVISEEIVIDELYTINIPDKSINNFIVLDDGMVILSNSERAAYLRKFNKSGIEEWYCWLHPKGSGEYYARKVVKTVDGYAVIGTFTTETTNKIFSTTRKENTFVYLVNSNGKEIAEKKVVNNSPTEWREHTELININAIEISPSKNGYYAIGKGRIKQGGYYSYDSHIVGGNIQWERSIGERYLRQSSKYPQIHTSCTASDGDLVIAGKNNSQAYIAKISSIDGTIKWAREFMEKGSIVLKVQLTSDNGFLVLGRDFIVKFNKFGFNEWETIMDREKHGYARGLAESLNYFFVNTVVDDFPYIIIFDKKGAIKGETKFKRYNRIHHIINKGNDIYGLLLKNNEKIFVKLNVE